MEIKFFFLTILLKKKIFLFSSMEKVSLFTPSGHFDRFGFFFSHFHFSRSGLFLLLSDFFFTIYFHPLRLFYIFFCFFFFGFYFTEKRNGFHLWNYVYDYPHTVRDVDTFTSMVVKKGNDTTNLACKKKKRIFFVNRPHLFFFSRFLFKCINTYLYNKPSIKLLLYFCTLKDLLCQVVAVDYNIGGIVVG